MRKVAGWVIALLPDLLGLALTASGFTPPPARIRYTIDNRTNQAVSTILQLESADSSFIAADTTEVKDDLSGNYVGLPHQHHRFNRYIKLLIQTNKRQYSSPIFTYTGRCTAYTLELTENAVIVEESLYYRLRSQVVQFLIVFLITIAIKGVPFYFAARQAPRAIYGAFLLCNTGAAVALLVVGHLFPTRLALYLCALALTFALELLSYYRLSSTAPQRSKLITASLIGWLLAIFPGLLFVALLLLFYGGC